MKEINVTFVTGSEKKREYLEKFLGLKIKNKKVDLDEIQSLDLHEVVKSKLLHAYEILKSPVLVEDVGLEFSALGKLPGTFVKFFIQEAGLQNMSDMLAGKDRTAYAKCVFGYYDGKDMKFWEGSLEGQIAEKVGEAGPHGYGWDQIFIPLGYEKVRSQLDEVGDRETYLKIKPILEVKRFLETL